MELGICYTVYNGLELLEGSIIQIYPYVDTIVLAFQEVSNTGVYSIEPRKEVERLKKKYEKISIVEYRANPTFDTKTNELNKHNLGLKCLKKTGVSHFMMSATDHYYNPVEFVKAKEIANDYDLTLTAMYTYYKHPTWQITPIENYYMPFIMKLHNETEFKKGVWSLPYLVDPSVRINTFGKHYLFKESEIMMHHYSMIRNDIYNKFKNSASSSRWGDNAKIYLDEYLNATIDSKIAYFKGRGLKEVEDYFKLIQ